MERLDTYSPHIAQSSPYLHLYQLIIVEDILGYSRDIGSRNTLWIPSDFTVKELIKYLQTECINDPKLCEIRRIDCYLNPFQANNWNSIHHLSELDGSIDYRNESQSRRIPTPFNEYREVEPIELLKIREKARNTTFDSEQYIDSSDFFNYWHVPDKQLINTPHGTDPKVPEYITKEKSQCDKIEGRDYLQQIDEVEQKLNAKLLQRKQWYLEQKDQIENDDLLQDEFDDKSIEYEVMSHKTDVGQHLNIEITKKQSEDTTKQKSRKTKGQKTEITEDANIRCSIHFPKK